MPRSHKFVLKLAGCLLLCLALLLTRERLAVAQSAAPAPAVAAPTVAAPAPVTTPAILPAPALGTAKPLAPAPIETAAPPPTPGQLPTVVTVSIIGMVRHADPIVQGVMLFLVLCSAASWAAFFFKSITLAIAKRNTERFRDMFQTNAVSMAQAGEALARAPDGAARKMWQAAWAEWDASLRIAPLPLDAGQTTRLLQRLVLVMGSSEERSLSRLGNWMGLLATVGSTAPFIGLFGTVWGILDSFEHISASFNTSLTVVAPGIAEALLATAAGLFAAIPATMFYNRFAREIGKVTGMLDNVTAEIVVFVSRDVERPSK